MAHFHATVLVFVLLGEGVLWAIEPEATPAGETGATFRTLDGFSMEVLAAEPLVVGEQCLELWSWGISKCLADRDAGLDDRFIDVLYEHTRKDPMHSIATIYERLGRPFTDEARDSMKRWGDDNRRDKRAAHSYTLEEFGYTREGICEAFADYRERFIVGQAEAR